MTLNILDGNDAPFELGVLAMGIVAREDGIDTVNEDAIDRMAIRIYYVHLPLMAEMGVLNYEPDENLNRFS